MIKAVDSAIQKIMRTAQRKDVVPVDPTKWTQPPVFKATATRIFTRLFNRSGGAERFPGIGGAARSPQSQRLSRRMIVRRSPRSGRISSTSSARCRLERHTGGMRGRRPSVRPIHNVGLLSAQQVVARRQGCLLQQGDDDADPVRDGYREQLECRLRAVPDISGGAGPHRDDQDTDDYQGQTAGNGRWPHSAPPAGAVVHVCIICVSVFPCHNGFNPALRRRLSRSSPRRTSRHEDGL